MEKIVRQWCTFEDTSSDLWRNKIVSSKSWSMESLSSRPEIGIHCNHSLDWNWLIRIEGNQQLDKTEKGDRGHPCLMPRSILKISPEIHRQELKQEWRKHICWSTCYQNPPNTWQTKGSVNRRCHKPSRSQVKYETFFIFFHGFKNLGGYNPTIVDVMPSNQIKQFGCGLQIDWWLIEVCP